MAADGAAESRLLSGEPTPHADTATSVCYRDRACLVSAHGVVRPTPVSQMHQPGQGVNPWCGGPDAVGVPEWHHRSTGASSPTLYIRSLALHSWRQWPQSLVVPSGAEGFTATLVGAVECH